MLLSLSEMQSDVGSLPGAIAQTGFKFLKSWRPAVSSEEIVACVGRGLIFDKSTPVHRVVPRADAAPNTYSGIYGLNQFPLHTDMAHWRNPPRFMMLRCVEGYVGVATILVDGLEVVAKVGGEKLTRALVKPRRPFNGSVPLLSIFRRTRPNHAALLRWDERFIVPASPAGEQGMHLVRQALTDASTIPIYLCAPGDTLLIDNWRMLHGRSAVAQDQIGRIIERAYFGELY